MSRTNFDEYLKQIDEEDKHELFNLLGDVLHAVARSGQQGMVQLTYTGKIDKDTGALSVTRSFKHRRPTGDGHIQKNSNVDCLLDLDGII